jgi:hypothetical protein
MTIQSSEQGSGSLENGNLNKAKSLASKGFQKKSGNLKW